MKKNFFKAAILLFASLLTANGAMAQNEKKNAFVVEAGIGVNKYFNFPPLSPIAGSNDKTYLAPTEIIMAGYRINKVMFAAQYQLTNTYFANHREVPDISEPVEARGLCHQTILLTGRWYESIINSIEIYGGLKFGLSIMYNTGGIYLTDYTLFSNRYGFVEEFEIGLNWKMTNYSYMGIRAGIAPWSINFGQNSPGNDKIFSSYNISISYAFKF
ncbi:MAG: hypothetical protein IKD33_02770 [Bacteroidales bacterium]|nr:hypothetical protein [Bacteroidales bacterium]